MNGQKNIITASGTAADVCEKLRILAAIFPKGATLAGCTPCKKKIKK